MEDYKCGLWQKTSKKGTNYYSGKIEINGVSYFVTLFENKFKQNEKQPDYNVIIKEDMCAKTEEEMEQERIDNRPDPVALDYMLQDEDDELPF